MANFAAKMGFTFFGKYSNNGASANDIDDNSSIGNANVSNISGGASFINEEEAKEKIVRLQQSRKHDQVKIQKLNKTVSKAKAKIKKQSEMEQFLKREIDREMKETSKYQRKFEEMKAACEKMKIRYES